MYQPQVKKNVEGDKTQLYIRARNEKELREILAGIAKKNPALNVEKAMKLAQWRYEEFDEPLLIAVEVGGSEVFRAICKCAINFYIYKRGNPLEIKHLLPYIQGKEDKEIVWMHYKDDLYSLEPDESFHLLHMVGNSKDKILYCYVDYFNSYKYIVLLNDNYQGEDILETYCFDLINALQIQKEINIEYNRSTLLDFFKNKDTTFFKRVQDAFNHSIVLGQARQRSFQINRIVEESIQSSFQKYPEGTPLTEDMLKDNLDELINKITPYLLNTRKNTKRDSFK